MNPWLSSKRASSFQKSSSSSLCFRTSWTVWSSKAALAVHMAKYQRKNCKRWTTSRSSWMTSTTTSWWIQTELWRLWSNFVSRASFKTKRTRQTFWESPSNCSAKFLSFAQPRRTSKIKEQTKSTTAKSCWRLSWSASSTMYPTKSMYRSTSGSVSSRWSSRSWPSYLSARTPLAKSKTSSSSFWTRGDSHATNDKAKPSTSQKKWRRILPSCWSNCLQSQTNR